jgi:hypothetical protein
MTQKQTPRRSVPTPRPATVPAAAPPAQPKPRELAPIQQFIADAVAHLIVNGGHDDDLDSILWHAIAHEWQRTTNYLVDEPQKAREGAEKRAGNVHQEYKAELLMAIRQNRKATPAETIEPKTATERIRANLIDTLSYKFEEFLRDATPEERYLMLEILMDHDSGNHGSDAFDELPLARAFDYALGIAAPEYVKVPYTMRKTVEAYIEALKAANVKDKAA